jgi:hypothetical protein
MTSAKTATSFVVMLCIVYIETWASVLLVIKNWQNVEQNEKE